MKLGWELGLCQPESQHDQILVALVVFAEPVTIVGTRNVQK